MELAEIKALAAQELGEETANKMYGDMDEMGMGPTSFADMLEAKQAGDIANKIDDLSRMFRQLAFNICYNHMIEDKVSSLKDLADEYGTLVNAVTEQTKSTSLLDWVKEHIPGFSKEAMMKMEDGKKFSKSMYAYTPSDKPSDWKLRLCDMDGKVTKSQLGAAAAALSPGGFRGNRVKLPSNAVAGVKAKIRSEYKKLGVKPEDMPDSVKSLDSFYVFKDGSNDWRWVSFHTNKFEDREGEVIASFAHKEFVEAVDNGNWPYPELWVWHATASSVVGVADMLHYDEETGIVMSTGTFFKEKAHVAEGLAKYPDPLRTSHGMPREHLIYAADDPSLIVHYRTREISPLPLGAEANKFTPFAIFTDGGQA